MAKQTPGRSEGELPLWGNIALTFRRIRKVARQSLRSGSKRKTKQGRSRAPKEASSGTNEPMSNTDLYEKTYLTHVDNLKKNLDADVALQQAVGGHFKAVGELERALLIQLGLKGSDRLIDVGCGSGRLACQLASMPDLAYLGTDVVPELLGYARNLCKRDDWEFVTAKGLSIPSADQSADFVCFFSVLTHLRHEDSYLLLREAKRVLKAGGRVVFSFLEFHIPSHWALFEPLTNKARHVSHVDQFIGRDAIHAWAYHLGMQVDAIFDGDKPHIKYEGTITWDDGRTMINEGSLGQSVAVLSLPVAAPSAA